MTWTPIISRDSNFGSRVWDAIQSIADALANKHYELSFRAKSSIRAYEESLLYGYLAVALNDLEWARHATQRLNQEIDGAAANPPTQVGLFGGLTGLGWIVEHLSHLLQEVSLPSEEDVYNSIPDLEGDETEDEDLNVEIDAKILKTLLTGNSSKAYDLISGLVGLGTYLIERLPRESAVQGIKSIFCQLESLAEHVDGKIAWYSEPELLPDWQREQCPNGYYNLGVAHGIPGIIHFLGEVSAIGIVEPERSDKLLTGAMSWLIAQQRPLGSRSRFSSWLSPGKPSNDCRMAWCYGDLGILSVSLQVAHRTGRQDWMDFAEQLLNHCLAYPPAEAGIADAPLCHGATGVAHMFNRIYQTEGDRRCFDAALLWYERALDFRQPGEGIGGFSSLTRPDPSGRLVWESSPAFLDGAVGVALAFLAAVTGVEPKWDRMLLLSGHCNAPYCNTL
jgi:hypothetical protein